MWLYKLGLEKFASLNAPHAEKFDFRKNDRSKTSFSINLLSKTFFFQKTLYRKTRFRKSDGSLCGQAGTRMLVAVNAGPSTAAVLAKY
jgi:hypothetical protein